MTKNEFITRRLGEFAEGIPKKTLKKYVVSNGNLIWHVFSWELLPEGSYLMGDFARTAYDAIDKTDAICIEYFAEDDCRPVSEQQSSSALLDEYTEIYVAARDFSWTYIKTHEGDSCGPYFCQK